MRLPKFTDWRIEQGRPTEFNLDTLLSPTEAEPVTVGSLEPEPEPAWAEEGKWTDYSLEEWTTVPGIGKTLAERIVEHLNSNTIEDVEDLRSVKGVSQRVVDNIKSHLKG